MKQLKEIIFGNTNIPRAFSGLLRVHEKSFTFKERATLLMNAFMISGVAGPFSNLPSGLVQD